MNPGKPVWKVAVAQIPIEMGNKRANVAAVVGAITAAGEKGCDIVVLPECCLAGWLSPAASACAETIPGPLTRRLSVLARQHRIAIIIGMEERAEEGRLFNSALLFDHDGRMKAHHRKVNELDVARTTYTPGASLRSVELLGKPVALSICADSWRPEITDALYLLGARVIFSPSASAVEPGGEATNLSWIIEAYRQRTWNRDLIVIAANGVGPVTHGPWRGRVLQGNSLVIGANGKVLLRGPVNEPALLCWQVPAR